MLGRSARKVGMNGGRKEISRDTGRGYVRFRFLGRSKGEDPCYGGSSMLKQRFSKHSLIRAAWLGAVSPFSIRRAQTASAGLEIADHGRHLHSDDDCAIDVGSRNRVLTAAHHTRVFSIPKE